MDYPDDPNSVANSMPPENVTMPTALDQMKAYLSNMPESIRMHIVGEHVDDSQQLVAYRLRFKNRVQGKWFVAYRGYWIAHIGRQDSQWVHDNWVYEYRWPAIKEVMPREARSEFDRAMKQLGWAIKEAVTEKRADIVTLPFPS